MNNTYGTYTKKTLIALKIMGKYPRCEEVSKDMSIIHKLRRKVTVSTGR